MKVRILQFSTTFTQVYTRPKSNLLGSSLAFTLKEGPVRCAKVCNKSWVILLVISGVQDGLVGGDGIGLRVLFGDKVYFAGRFGLIFGFFGQHLVLLVSLVSGRIREIDRVHFAETSGLRAYCPNIYTVIKGIFHTGTLQCSKTFNDFVLSNWYSISF